MLARANSDAAARLRRAKSFSSVHSHRPESVQSGPAARQAEVAAAEAYRRAHPDVFTMSTAAQDHQKTRSRRRPTTRSEFSHFEDSRAGHRMGGEHAARGQRSRASTLDQPQKTYAEGASTRPQQAHVKARTIVEDDETTIVTRPRKAIDTSIKSLPSQQRSGDVKHSGRNYTHRGRSATHPSSNEKTSIQRDDLSYRVPTRSTQQNKNRGSNNVEASASRRDPRANTISPRLITKEPVTTEPPNSRLRGKKSFIDPVKTLVTKSPPEQVKQPAHDASLPPFNCIGEQSDAFGLDPRAPPMPPPGKRMTSQRSFSGGLKERIRKIIGKKTRVVTEFPAQHITATQFHFDLLGNEGTVGPLASLVPERSPPLPPHLLHSDGLEYARSTSGRSIHSLHLSNAGRSRVTSWTDSTAPGTMRSKTSQNRLSSINETSVPAGDQDTTSSTRNGSLLGRALRYPLHRQSRSQLRRSSEESRQLCDALSKQISNPDLSHEAGLDASIDAALMSPESAIPHEPDDAATVDIMLPAFDRSHKPTIRAVGPDTARVPSSKQARTRVKMLAQTSDGPMGDRVEVHEIPSSIFSKPSASMRHNEGRQEVLSPEEQRARRHDRAQKRWQSTLTDESPIASRAMRYAEEDNPYELKPLYPEQHDSYLPTAIRHKTSRQAFRPTLPKVDACDSNAAALRNVVSPSVYSERTDNTTPRPSTPVQTFTHGSVVTITGREVKRYSLDSPTKSTGIRPSLEWKNWLSKELQDFDMSPEPGDLSLMGDGARPTFQMDPGDAQLTVRRDSPMWHRKASGPSASDVGINTVSEDQGRMPPIQAIKTRRPIPTRKTSNNIMNERYPLIESVQKANDKGQKRFRAIQRKVSETSLSALRRVSSTSRRASKTAVLDTKLQHVGRSLEKAEPITQRLGSANSTADCRPSSAQLQATSLHSSAQSTSSSPADSTTNLGIPGGFPCVAPLAPSPATTSSQALKPKSCVDLRAHYRPSTSSLRESSSSVIIRRRPVVSAQFEDQTLQKITEGPYASDATRLASGQASKDKENTLPTIFSANPSPTCSKSLTSSVHSEKWADHGQRPGQGHGKESPGRRMAESFLSSRRLGDASGNAASVGSSRSSPAFV